MNRFIALLRGINVSGQKKIKMADLKSLIGELPFSQVETYIQSGNIVFSSETEDAALLASQISDRIKQEYGYEVEVIIRTAADLHHILMHNPFCEYQSIDQKALYVTFLASAPAPDAVMAIDADAFLPEKFVVAGSSIYFYAANGYGRAKMNNTFFERKLKVKATTRNWKTVRKLVEMARAVKQQHD